MNTGRLILALLALIVTSCDRAPKVDPSAPEAYAVQRQLEPALGGLLQRLVLPSEVLVALKRNDLGDIRVFDARGKIVPLALLPAQSETMQQRNTVPVYSVMGPPTALIGTGVSIRIEGNSIARVVTIGTSGPPTDISRPFAALLDTRSLRQPVIAIAPDVEMPAGRPVLLTVFASSNLKDWSRLVEKVLFRPEGARDPLGGAKIELPSVDLRDRYIGISWGSATDVSVRSANIITSTVAPLERIAIETQGVSVGDAHNLNFEMPNLARLAAIRVIGADADGVVPIKLYGRNRAEDPWALLSGSILRPGTGGALLELTGAPMSLYRLEADARTAGFSTVPKLAFIFDPVELLVALNGMAPYRLATGQSAAPAAFLALAEIVPHGQLQKLADLPRAKLAGPSGPPPVIVLQSAATVGALEPRRLALWGALLLGTLVLAFAAIRLLRGNAKVTAAKDE